MTDRSEMLKARLKERRAKMKETQEETDAKPSSKSNLTLDDSKDENAVLASTSQEVEEDQESKKLLKTLKKTRKKRQKELDQTLRGRETVDVTASAELRLAKAETAKHVYEAEQRSATEDESEVLHTWSLGSRDPASTDQIQSESTVASKSSTSSPDKRRSEDEVRAKRTRSQGLSYKEKLAQRLKQAKDKAKDDAYADSGRRLGGLRDSTLPTRFDAPQMMRKEDLEAEEQLQQSLSKRDKWKEMMTKVIKARFHIPNPEEQYDFFTRQWEPDPEQEKLDREKSEKQLKTAAEGSTEKGEEKVEEGEASTSAAKVGDTEEEPLLDDDLDQEEDSWRFYQMSRAEYAGFRQQLIKEAKVYFIPSVISAPISERLGTTDVARFPEEEGLYVGERPIMPNSALHKMENRLVKEKKKDWFGEDGSLIALPEPLKENPSRPFVPEEIQEPALQVEYCKAFVNEFDSRFIDGSVEAHGLYRLDVDINTIVFTHHHLFSREHVLSSKLTQLYDQYVSRQKKQAADFLHEKLEALKSATAHVQANIQALQADKRNRKKQSFDDQENRLKDYRYEIRQTRRQWHTELRADRLLLKHMIDTWKDIRSLRSFQGYTNTPTKLTIRKETADKAEDERVWEADIEDEMEEMKQELLEEFENQMEIYNKDLEKYKAQKQAKKDAKARQKQRRKVHEEGPSDDTEITANEEEEINRDQEILEEDDLAKPQKPTLGGNTEARHRILSLYNEIRRKPGEAKLYPELTSGATITPNQQCPKGEQTRRHDVNRFRVFVKVLFNNKEVSRTPAKSIGQDFIVRFVQIFNIEIVQWPESVKLQIYESSGIGHTLMTDVFCAIPDANVTTETVQLEEVEFSGDHKVHHHHEGVGSGVAFSFEKDNSNMMSLMTSGTFTTSVAWGVDQSGVPLVPPTGGQTDQVVSAMKSMDAVAGIGMEGMQDMDKLSAWISKSRLDPNDPSNAALMYVMKPGGAGDHGVMSLLRMPEHFRLEQLMEEFDLASDDDLDNSLRYRMIRLREQEIPEFKNKTIPAHDKEVPEETFIEYEKKLKLEDKVKSAEDVDSHRVAVAKFMQNVREKVMMRFRLMAHQKSLQDIVFEDAVPNIATIIPNLMKLAEPRRPLKPTRKERKKVTAQNLQAMDVKLLVNVVRAVEVPVRAEGLAGPEGQRSARGTGGKVKNIAGETLVRPFVEVMFQRNSMCTSVADGPNPSWNEELQIPFKAPNNDYTAANLQTVNDTLFLNLFDEYIIDVQQSDKDRGTSINRRIEKRWLGSIKIPFSTIYFNARIDGTFRLNKPLVLLGYSADTRNNRLDTGMDINMGEGEHTYLTVFVTIEPALTPPEPTREKFDSNEDEKLLISSETWQNTLHSKFPKREIKTTVVDINGKAIFITRYFKGLKPPNELLADDNTKYEAVARYVSLIPFVSDSVVFPGLCDIWSTCDQFLQMLQGDEEEHAVLLVNYFQKMGKPAWLLLGSAIPEGPTAYVLTKEPDDFWIWNASDGQHFSYRDNYCPVQSVGCLVNEDNIWANIQPNEQPSRISFDLGNTSNWKPFFNKSYPNPGLASIQPESLIYFPTEQNKVYEIQEKIERMLKDKVMSWRPKFITRWNRYCVQSFRRLLAKLEQSHGKGTQNQHSAELEQVLSSYKLCGFPINLPYTEMEPIVEAVYATGVHKLETSEAEFALAVHIHPYPNSVLSVWIYVASLMRKR